MIGGYTSSVWFFGGVEPLGSRARQLAARIAKLEAEAQSQGELMDSYASVHAEVDRRVEKLEDELAAARQERLEIHNQWWEAREGHNRAMHVARRLRRRLNRLYRRGALLPAEE